VHWFQRLSKNREAGIGAVFKNRTMVFCTAFTSSLELSPLAAGKDVRGRFSIRIQERRLAKQTGYQASKAFQAGYSWRLSGEYHLG